MLLLVFFPLVVDIATTHGFSVIGDRTPRSSRRAMTMVPAPPSPLPPIPPGTTAGARRMTRSSPMLPIAALAANNDRGGRSSTTAIAAKKTRGGGGGGAGDDEDEDVGADDEKGNKILGGVFRKSPGAVIVAPFVLLFGLDLIANIAVVTKRSLEVLFTGEYTVWTPWQ